MGVLPSAPASLHVLQANSTALYSLRLATYASCRTRAASSSWHRMVIPEKSPFLDPLVMNSSTTTGGRWCPPASNAETFMSSSPSYCAGASPGMWGGQGNDITSQLERRDWMRKNLTGSSIKDTTSSPASLWGTSFSSQNTGSSRSSLVGGGGSQGSMWASGSFNVEQGSSGWSSRGIGASEQRCSSTWSSSSRGYRTDRLMQMD